VAKSQPLIQINDLNRFINQMKRIDPTFDARIKQANYDAADVVVQRATVRYRSKYRSMSTRTKAGIRALQQAKAAKVRVGGKSTPYLLGQEFGSGKYPQFPAHNEEGYWLFPSINEELPRLRREYLTLLDQVVKQTGAFPR
jgi:hypothetical protein